MKASKNSWATIGLVLAVTFNGCANNEQPTENQEPQSSGQVVSSETYLDNQITATVETSPDKKDNLNVSTSFDGGFKTHAFDGLKNIKNDTSIRKGDYVFPISTQLLGPKGEITLAFIIHADPFHAEEINAVPMNKRWAGNSYLSVFEPTNNVLKVGTDHPDFQKMYESFGRHISENPQYGIEIDIILEVCEEGQRRWRLKNSPTPSPAPGVE